MNSSHEEVISARLRFEGKHRGSGRVSRVNLSSNLKGSRARGSEITPVRNFRGYARGLCRVPVPYRLKGSPDINAPLILTGEEIERRRDITCAHLSILSLLIQRPSGFRGTIIKIELPRFFLLPFFSPLPSASSVAHSSAFFPYRALFPLIPDFLF